MIYPKLSIHGIVKIEIEENEVLENDPVRDTAWRHVVFTDEEGNEFTVTAFAAHPSTEGVPVTFVRDLEKGEA
jgi:hypothetical protein